MALALNSAFGKERSSISTRERQRLDKIANSKQMSDGREIRHPRFIKVVETFGDLIYLNLEPILHDDLIDKAIYERFEICYFSHVALDEEIDNLCFLLKTLDVLPLGSDLNGVEKEVIFRTPEGCSRRRQKKNRSEWLVGHLAGIYKRVFRLEPYLGGVGANEEEREPNSPFGVFAKFVLDRLDIRTRNGSRYSLGTIKNHRGPSDVRGARLPDEPQLVAAREELEVEFSLKRGRGRPPK